MGGAILIRVVSNDWEAIDYGGVYHGEQNGWKLQVGSALFYKVFIPFLAVLQMIRDVIVEIPDDPLLKLRELSIRFERKKKVELIRIMRNGEKWGRHEFLTVKGQRDINKSVFEENG